MLSLRVHHIIVTGSSHDRVKSFMNLKAFDVRNGIRAGSSRMVRPQVAAFLALSF